MASSESVFILKGREAQAVQSFLNYLRVVRQGGTAFNQLGQKAGRAGRHATNQWQQMIPTARQLIGGMLGLQTASQAVLRVQQLITAEFERQKAFRTEAGQTQTTFGRELRNLSRLLPQRLLEEEGDTLADIQEDILQRLFGKKPEEAVEFARSGISTSTEGTFRERAIRGLDIAGMFRGEATDDIKKAIAAVNRAMANFGGTVEQQAGAIAQLKSVSLSDDMGKLAEAIQGAINDVGGLFRVAGKPPAERLKEQERITEQVLAFQERVGAGAEPHLVRTNIVKVITQVIEEATARGADIRSMQDVRSFLDENDEVRAKLLGAFAAIFESSGLSEKQLKDLDTAMRKGKDPAKVLRRGVRQRERTVIGALEFIAPREQVSGRGQFGDILKRTERQVGSIEQAERQLERSNQAALELGAVQVTQFEEAMADAANKVRAKSSEGMRGALITMIDEHGKQLGFNFVGEKLQQAINALSPTGTQEQELERIEQIVRDQIGTVRRRATNPFGMPGPGARSLGEMDAFLKDPSNATERQRLQLEALRELLQFLRAQKGEDQGTPTLDDLGQQLRTMPAPVSPTEVIIVGSRAELAVRSQDNQRRTPAPSAANGGVNPELPEGVS